jgi:hypothetical protein
MSDADVRTLARLRHRLAGTERMSALREIAAGASDLAAVAPDSLLAEIADFQDRVAEKIVAVGGTPVLKRKQPTPPPTGAAAVKMHISEWTDLETGVRSRSICNAEDAMEPLPS